MLTEDCPVGLRAKAVLLKRRLSFAMSGILSVAGAFAQAPSKPDQLVQVETDARAELAGVVLDQGGYPLARTHLTLADKKSGKSISASSDERGEYQFSRVERGTYTLKPELQGFKESTKKDISLGAEIKVHVDLVLQVAVSNMGGSIVATPARKSSAKRSPLL